MRSYEEIIGDYKLVIWDKVSPIRCSTGVFSADEIKQHWQIGQGAEVFYVVKGRNRTVPSLYGTDLGTPYDTEDVVECGMLSVKDMVESDYRSALAEGEEFVPCNMALIEAALMVVDMRV